MQLQVKAMNLMGLLFSMRFLQIALISGLLGLSNLSQAQGIPQDDPEKMVTALSNRVIYELNTNREVFEREPSQVKLFATNYVLPYIDTEKMARYVMGRNWRSASPAQQDAFVKAFTNTLIRSYSQSLLKLKIESVAVLPAQVEKPGRVTVASSVKQADGNKSDVIYRAYLDKKSGKWMLYDVSVEGISMLLNYRKAYDSDITKKGLDAVISEMQSKNAAFNGLSNG